MERGPAENRTRPAVDRGPAVPFGRARLRPRVAGVISFGTLSDGNAGFAEIKRRGGATIVQDPDEAE